MLWRTPDFGREGECGTEGTRVRFVCNIITEQRSCPYAYFCQPIVVHNKTARGHAVTHVVETLRNNPEGRGLYFRSCHSNFSLTQSFRQDHGPGVDSVSTRNEYQVYFLEGKGGRCEGLKTLLPSLLIVYLGVSTSWNSQSLFKDCFTYDIIG
jgi:hypothetical protein